MPVILTRRGAQLQLGPHVPQPDTPKSFRLPNGSGWTWCGRALARRELQSQASWVAAGFLDELAARSEWTEHHHRLFE